MKVYLIKLRKILLCDYFFIIILIISILLLFVRCNIKHKSIYNNNTKFVVGTVTDYYIDGNKLSITLDCNEKIIGTYYFKSRKSLNIFKKNIILGDKLKIYGSLSKPISSRTKNMFDYNKYLQRKGIFYTVNISNIEFISNSHNIYYIIKNKIINKINNNPYLYTFILGNTDYINDDVLRSFRENGISHLFAISGMHITLLSSIIMKILKKFL